MLPGNTQELENIRRECLRMSNKRALLSAVASAVPIPFTDIATDIVLLRQIIPRISDKFGLSREQIDEYGPELAVFIYDGAKRLGSNMIGRFITKELVMQVLKKLGVRMTTKQVAKYVPIIGQVVSAGISYAAMRLIIRSHINECCRVAETVIQKRNAGARF